MLTKLDITRDLRGAFYAPGDWKVKHNELAAALGKWVGASFRDNGNSFNSCFQFEGCAPFGQLSMKIKVYWKSLALIQSEAAAKSIGMNMKGLFYPNIRMGKALQESANETMSRIEITYKASTLSAQGELLAAEFNNRSKADLDKAF